MKENEHSEALLLGAEGLTANHNEDICIGKKKEEDGWKAIWKQTQL